jgi:uncharacterized delta-60 repeat protein
MVEQVLKMSPDGVEVPAGDARRIVSALWRSSPSTRLALPPGVSVSMRVVAMVAAVGVLWLAPAAQAAVPGTLDQSFGRGGLVRTGLESRTESGSCCELRAPRAVVTLADGAIVAGGSAMDATGAPAFGLERYTRAGRLDRRWGDGGRVVVPFGDATAGGSRVQALLAAPDGGVIAAGTSAGGGVATARLDTRGRIVWASAPVLAYAAGGPRAWVQSGGLALDGAGRVLVAGIAQGGFPRDPGVVRLRVADGALDLSFGTGGLAVDPSTDDCPLFGFVQVTGVVARPAGDVTVGSFREVCGVSASSPPIGKLSRFDAAGRLVASRHGSDVGLEYDLIGLAAGPRAGLVAAGNGYEGAALARYRADGHLDRRFGDGGVRRLRAHGSVTSGVQVQPDGRLLVGVVGADGDARVFRRLPGGARDRGFATPVMRRSGPYPTALALQPGGGIIVAGPHRTRRDTLDTGVLLARLHGRAVGREREAIAYGHRRR